VDPPTAAGMGLAHAAAGVEPSRWGTAIAYLPRRAREQFADERASVNHRAAIGAGRLVEAFGTGVFDVIEQSPALLQEIDGIGKKRANKITSGGADQKVIREIMVFLHPHGVSTSRAVRI